jgi:hypothetical protein
LSASFGIYVLRGRIRKASAARGQASAQRAGGVVIDSVGHVQFAGWVDRASAEGRSAAGL